MTTIADMVRTIARIGAAARRFGDALRRWSPTPPAAFVKRAAQLRERGGTPDHLDMVRLFALAAPPAEWRDRPGRRRTGWLKHAGNRYIAKCLHHAAGIPGGPSDRALGARPSPKRWARRSGRTRGPSSAHGRNSNSGTRPAVAVT